MRLTTRSSQLRDLVRRLDLLEQGLREWEPVLDQINLLAGLGWNGLEGGLCLLATTVIVCGLAAL